MARVNSSFWFRNRYKFNGLFLILPFYFFYQSLFPEFPEAWNAQQIGSFEISPMPYNLDQPYFHDGHFIKDFFLIFSQGKVTDIRQAYLNIGIKPLPLAALQKGGEGILHGSQHGQEVHAIAPEKLKFGDKMWLTIENWQGKKMVTSWNLPKELLKE